MGHYLYAYLAVESILNALVAWEHKKNWERHTMKWIIRRFNSSFKTLVQITLIDTRTPNIEPYGGCLVKINSISTYNTDVFIAQTQKISKRRITEDTSGRDNSRTKTVDTLGDVQSRQPICPSNILTMNSKIVLPPPGHFVNADEYSRKRWGQIQHIANQFCVRWRKESLWPLQPPHKWNEKHRNFQNGDIVLLKTDTNRNQ